MVLDPIIRQRQGPTVYYLSGVVSPEDNLLDARTLRMGKNSNIFMSMMSVA